MQDRSPLARETLLRRTAGPYIRVRLDKTHGASWRDLLQEFGHLLQPLRPLAARWCLGPYYERTGCRSWRSCADERHFRCPRASARLMSASPRAGGANPEIWAKVANRSLEHVSRIEAHRMLGEAGTGAGMAIVLGNILDTIPGGLVIAAKFSGFETLSFTLMLGMFLGGIPEAAASAAMLTTAGYRACAIFGLWSIVVVAGAAAAVAGKAFVGSSDALMAIFSQALAGGAILAVIAHAMIPEAIDKGGLLVVLPTVGGFLFALFLALDGRALRIALICTLFG
jgi:hypothetical protein